MYALRNELPRQSQQLRSVDVLTYFAVQKEFERCRSMKISATPWCMRRKYVTIKVRYILPVYCIFTVGYYV
jgi:hypothetical protein